MWANKSSLAARQQNLKENYYYCTIHFAILSDELVSVAGWGGAHCSQTFETPLADSLDFVVFFSFILFYFPRGFRILGNIWLEITSYYYYKKSFLLWNGT